MATIIKDKSTPIGLMEEPAPEIAMAPEAADLPTDEAASPEAAEEDED